MPTKPGVYIFKNEKSKIIYIGKARNLKKRVSSYFTNKALEAKTLKLVSEATSVDHIVVASEIEAFLLESSLVKKYKPIYNVKLTDDKSFPYVEIAKNPVPYVVLTRNTNNKSATFLGPYTSTTDLKIVLRLLRRIFPYQSVKNHPNRRCLYSHINLCPCIQVYPERLPEYKNSIKNLTSFLKGNIDKVLLDLRKQQKEYVKKEEFENAGEIQRKIEKITAITSEVYAPFKYEEKPDFYFERIRNELLSLKEILVKYDITSTLERIECYDISNIQGKNATGSMVVFTNGDSNKNEYRRFKIKFKKTPDDFEMMREVLRRRAKRLDWNKPDLVVIDGGRGQVTAALQALTEYNYKVPLVGLAKREEVVVIPQSTGIGIEFIDVKLPKSTPGINLLRRLRDEAHRFAITYHRLLRKKAFIS